jgi:hypothetical protein
MTTIASRLANARKASNLKQPPVTSGQNFTTQKINNAKRIFEAVVDQ